MYRSTLCYERKCVWCAFDLSSGNIVILIIDILVSTKKNSKEVQWLAVMVHVPVRITQTKTICESHFITVMLTVSENYMDHTNINTHKESILET